MLTAEVRNEVPKSWTGFRAHNIDYPLGLSP